MAFDYSQVAKRGTLGTKPRVRRKIRKDLAINGAYLVSLRAHLAGKPDDGVRDSLSAGSLRGTL